MTAKDGIEIEVKFRVEDPEAMAEKIQGLGAKLIKSGLDRSIKYDRKDELKNKEELLRLRYGSSQPNITHKRRIDNAPEGFKVRQESIVRIDSVHQGKKLLEALGYSPAWTYEKKKRIWILGGVEVFLDIVPLIGCYMEIEGSPEEITRTAGKLGLDMKDAITKSYETLYREYIKKHELPEQDLIFPEGRDDK